MVAGHEIQKFLPGGRLVTEDADEGAGDDARLVRLDPAGGHAEVQALDVAGAALALELLVKEAREVVGRVLLEHRAPRHEVADARELADPEHLLQRDVRDADAEDDG